MSFMKMMQIPMEWVMKDSSSFQTDAPMVLIFVTSMFTFMDVEWRRAGLEMDMCKELGFFHLLRLMILS